MVTDESIRLFATFCFSLRIILAFVDFEVLWCDDWEYSTYWMLVWYMLLRCLTPSCHDTFVLPHFHAVVGTMSDLCDFVFYDLWFTMSSVIELTWGWGLGFNIQFLVPQLWPQFLNPQRTDCCRPRWFFHNLNTVRHCFLSVVIGNLVTLWFCLRYFSPDISDIFTNAAYVDQIFFYQCCSKFLPMLLRYFFTKSSKIFCSLFCSLAQTFVYQCCSDILLPMLLRYFVTIAAQRYLVLQ